MHNAAGDIEIMRRHAREHLHHHELAQAEALFAALLQQQPDDLEALQFLAARHLSRGEAGLAVGMLQQADNTQPGKPDILHQLGAAQSALGNTQNAVESLSHCVRLAPQMFIARLRLGMALEQQGDMHRALIAYFAAVNTAQSLGRWTSDATTAPGLRAAVHHAMQSIDRGRRALFDAVLEPLRQRYGRSALHRVDKCLAIYLGEKAPAYTDARQRPKFLYFPGIPSQPYYPCERFPWLDQLEATAADITQELQTLLQSGQHMEDFLGPQGAEAQSQMLTAKGNQAASWEAYFFFRHGQRYEAASASCPRTAAVLDTLPLVRIRDHAPETLFSVLKPGTHILPHRGVTNTRLVTHLPLIIPSDCALKVGGETHIWQPGRCITFDDTFEHEAWNRSDHTRVVLIADSWNPDLTDTERAAVTDLVEAIGDFNDACTIPAALT